jgi:hypothetical protein
MRSHLPARDQGFMVPAHASYMIWINRHLGATMLSAFPHDPITMTARTTRTRCLLALMVGRRCPAFVQLTESL